MLALLALAAAQPVMPIHESAGIPLREFRTLPDEDFVQRVLGPLGLFPLVSHRVTDTQRVPLLQETVWFWTRPRASQRPGVCAADRLMIAFRPSGHSRSNVTMQPVGTQLQTYYIIQDEAVARQSSGHPMDWGVRMVGLCPQIDPRTAQKAPADSGFQLMQGRELTGQLGEAARAGRSPAPLDCSRMNWLAPAPSDEAACLRDLALLRPQSVGWVSTCPPRREAPGGCVRVLTDRWFIEFDLTVGGDPLRITVNGIEDNSAIE